MHESITLDVSRVRANPASRNMKPACMKNTRNAVTSTHVVLMALKVSVWVGPPAAWTVAAPRGVSRYQPMPTMNRAMIPRPAILPPKYSAKYRRAFGSLICVRSFVMEAKVEARCCGSVRRP